VVKLSANHSRGSGNISIEFRLLLIGLGKLERERYYKLWFAREKMLASMPSDKLKHEYMSYISNLRKFSISVLSIITDNITWIFAILS